VGNDKANEASVEHRVEITGEPPSEPRPQGARRRCGPRLRCWGARGVANAVSAAAATRCRRDIVMFPPRGCSPVLAIRVAVSIMRLNQSAVERLLGIACDTNVSARQPTWAHRPK
jgi:hypothetical protein